MENLREAVVAVPEMTTGAVAAVPEMTPEEEDARIEAFFEAADNACKEAIVVRRIIAKRDGTNPPNNEDVEDLRGDLTQARQKARERREGDGIRDRRFVRNGFIGVGAGAGAVAGLFYGAMLGGPLVAAGLGIAGLVVGGALGGALGSLILIIIDKIKALVVSIQGKDHQVNIKVAMG